MGHLVPSGNLEAMAAAISFSLFGDTRLSPNEPLESRLGLNI